MLRPIFEQKYRRDVRMDAELRESLKWAVVLREGVAERRQWSADASRVVHLFYDTAGCLARLVAVLFDGKACFYTMTEPPAHVPAHF